MAHLHLPPYLLACLTALWPLALPAEPSPAPAALIPPEGVHITNGTLTVGLSARVAGAVNSIRYAGVELVNDHDHGRQMQTAWTYNGLGEADNPTEAGSVTDGEGETTTSRLLEVRAEGQTVTTRSHPAYWRPPVSSRQRKPSVVTELVTADTLEKTLTLGYQGDPHVIVVDTAITISPTLTAPAVASLIVEAPAFYAPPMMTESYLLDRSTGECLRHPPKSAQASTDPQRLLILSSGDGRFAVGLFAPKAENFLSYNCRYIDRQGKSDDNVAKVTLHFRQQAQAGDRLTYRTFAVVGDLETVKASLLKIH